MSKIQRIARALSNKLLLGLSLIFILYIFVLPIFGSLFALYIGIDWSKEHGWTGPEEIFPVCIMLVLQVSSTLAVVGLLEYCYG